MSEKEIEKILRDEVRKLGGRAYKWVSPGNDGAGPDRDLSRSAAGVRGTENRERTYVGTAEAAGAQASGIRAGCQDSLRN